VIRGGHSPRWAAEPAIIITIIIIIIIISKPFTKYVSTIPGNHEV
jgi:hypothetical protein